MGEIKIPIGRSSFADIRKNRYYYIDKSGLIKSLLKTDGTQVTLLTRPRRFGKTLNMYMLAEFFDNYDIIMVKLKKKRLFKWLTKN